MRLLRCKSSLLVSKTFEIGSILFYSQTSRKRPPKITRLRGRLREVVANESRRSGDFFLEEGETRLQFGRYQNSLHAIFNK